MAPAPSASRTRYKRKEEPRMELHCGCNASNSNESWNINNGQDYNNGEDISVTVCSTPKAQRFRIPEMLSCPPAPKKRRVTSSFVSDSNIRSPIPFFAPPEIELFFFLAFQNIPLWVDSYPYEKFDYEVTSINTLLATLLISVKCSVIRRSSFEWLMVNAALALSFPIVLLVFQMCRLCLYICCASIKVFFNGHFSCERICVFSIFFLTCYISSCDLGVLRYM